jgi:hypothetical protein
VYQIPILHPLMYPTGQLKSMPSLGWRLLVAWLTGFVLDMPTLAFFVAMGLVMQWLISIRSEEFYAPSSQNVSLLQVICIRLAIFAVMVFGWFLATSAPMTSVFACIAGYFTAIFIESFFSIKRSENPEIEK